jgi:hypothetical protein
MQETIEIKHQLDGISEMTEKLSQISDKISELLTLFKEVQELSVNVTLEHS